MFAIEPTVLSDTYIVTHAVYKTSYTLHYQDLVITNMIEGSFTNIIFWQEFYMNYEDRDTHGIYKGDNKASGVRLMGAETLIGNDVCNPNGDDLGDIKEIMLDTTTGQVCYAVLSFGGILGIGSKLFAVPWNALKLDTEEKHFVLNVDKDRLKNAPGFDKSHWPDMADKSWENEIHAYYGTTKQ